MSLYLNLSIELSCLPHIFYKKWIINIFSPIINTVLHIKEMKDKHRRLLQIGIHFQRKHVLSSSSTIALKVHIF